MPAIIIKIAKTLYRVIFSLKKIEAKMTAKSGAVLAKATA